MANSTPVELDETGLLASNIFENFTTSAQVQLSQEELNTSNIVATSCGLTQLNSAELEIANSSSSSNVIEIEAGRDIQNSTTSSSASNREQVLDNPNSTIRFHFGLCFSFFSTINDVMLHQGHHRVLISPAVWCPVCGQRYANNNGLYKHKRAAHQ